MRESENLQTLQFDVIANACVVFVRIANDGTLKPYILPFAAAALDDALATANGAQTKGAPLVMATSQDVQALDQRLLMTEWIADVAKGIVDG